MAVLHYRSSRESGVQRVFLATPAYSALSAGYAEAIFASSAALSKAGIVAELAILAGDCHVDDARNRLVRDFLNSSCTDLVFLDADLSWQPQDLVKLCQYDRDVVAATYPLKQDDEGFPVRYLGKEIWSDADGLIEVDGVPTGFLRIRRSVLEQLAKVSEQYKAKADQNGDVPLIFERTLSKGSRRGGDYTFCWKWRQLGGRIYLDPEITIDHTGDNTWSGSLGHQLRKDLMGALDAGIKEIRAGIDTPKTYQDMVLAWGNWWSCNATMLNTIALMARGSMGPILECGSGLSTLVMAAANPRIDVYALEHDEQWHGRVTGEAARLGLTNITVKLAPIEDGWYARDAVPDAQFALAVCDGPPRAVSDRHGLYEFGERLKGAIVVMDDAEDQNMVRGLEAWTKESNRKFQIIGRVRKFAVSSPRAN
jgi:predicted O-methyltransferase YrrM